MRGAGNCCSLLGSIVQVKTEKDFEVLASVTGLIVPYGLMGEIVKWYTSRDMAFRDALEYTNRMRESLSEFMHKDCGEDIEAFLMENNTPFGMNELALKMLRERGTYAPWTDAWTR